MSSRGIWRTFDAHRRNPELARQALRAQVERLEHELADLRERINSAGADTDGGELRRLEIEKREREWSLRNLRRGLEA